MPPSHPRPAPRQQQRQSWTESQEAARRLRSRLAQTQAAKMGRLETKERKWLPRLSHQFHQSRPGRGPQAAWAPPVLAKALSRPQCREAAGHALRGSGGGAGFLLSFTAQPRAQARLPARRRSAQPQPGHLSPRSKRRPRAGLALTPREAVRCGVRRQESKSGRWSRRAPQAPVVPSHAGHGLQAHRARPAAPRPAALLPPGSAWPLSSPGHSGSGRPGQRHRLWV